MPHPQNPTQSKPYSQDDLVVDLDNVVLAGLGVVAVLALVPLGDDAAPVDGTDPDLNAILLIEQVGPVRYACKARTGTQAGGSVQSPTASAGVAASGMVAIQ